ncbi:acetoacetyl-CoA synthetase [Podospora conica]|nr:acetoacetyl-CoA synthetase [Schizothecium conicum]
MDTTLPRKLWEHPDPKSTQMWKFMQTVNTSHNLQLKTFADLHRWSLTESSSFWSHLLEATPYVRSGSYTKVRHDETLPIDAVPRWFPGVTINFAENMLFSCDGPRRDKRATTFKEDSKVAVTEVREGASATQHITFGELRAAAGRVAAAMKARGVEKGDRVVMVASNSIDSLLVFLATTWLGALFSSSSTDMGVEGILQRAVQVNPKMLFMDDAALYNSKTVDLRDKMAQIESGLAGCSNFLGVVAMRRFDTALDISHVPRAETWDAFLARAGPRPTPPEFARIGFHEPFLICYSSGTTGNPKAIVHSVGGVLLNWYKEGVLHEGTGPDTVSLQYTTTGWIMYFAAVAPLLYGGRAILYDGSPFHPSPSILIELAATHRATKLGISPRYLFELSKAPTPPRDLLDLSSLRVVTSTGMALPPHLVTWFYDVAFPPHIHLANISGGTDIAGCFGIGNPLSPVYAGGTTQGPSLGVAVEIYDSLLPSGAPGRAVPHGTPGELVATAPFPNIPCFFWGDGDSAPGPRYRAAYFARFPGVWAHGDFCVVHPATGDISFLGRADGVLNPSGVRFGSAEVYGVLERRFADRVADSLCVGRRREKDTDEVVMLFLLMKPGCVYDAGLVAEVKRAIAQDLSKRHVPKFVFETKEIPTTINLKKVELPVKQIVSGHRITPSGTLANPQSLEYYYQFAEVEEEDEPVKGKL